VPLEAPKYFVSQSNSPTLRICLSLLQLDVVRWEQPILAMAIASPPTLINLKQIQGYITATLYCNWGTAAQSSEHIATACKIMFWQTKCTG